jgi:hypothetical protein
VTQRVFVFGAKAKTGFAFINGGYNAIFFGLGIYRKVVLTVVFKGNIFRMNQKRFLFFAGNKAGGEDAENKKYGNNSSKNHKFTSALIMPKKPGFVNLLA